MSSPAIQTAERTSADAAGRNGPTARAAARAAIGEAVGDYLDAALTAGTLTL